MWDILANSALLLRQLLEARPQIRCIYVIAGSPCQDLTVYGSSGGKLGFLGSRSYLMHAVWAVLHALEVLTANDPIEVMPLIENAGSMRPEMKNYLLTILNIPSANVGTINIDGWASTTRNRLFASRRPTETGRSLPPPQVSWM